jgi:NADH dehydrogenase/NADH:ubiquinone oxidoreductase subunit G
MINFTMNDRGVSGENGWTILAVAGEPGLDLPTPCLHGAVEPSGACRVCMGETGCGACLYFCPTGAMARFSARVREGGIFASGAGEPAASRSRP